MKKKRGWDKRMKGYYTQEVFQMIVNPSSLSQQQNDVRSDLITTVTIIRTHGVWRSTTLALVRVRVWVCSEEVDTRTRRFLRCTLRVSTSFWSSVKRMRPSFPPPFCASTMNSQFLWKHMNIHFIMNTTVILVNHLCLTVFCLVDVRRVDSRSTEKTHSNLS